MAFAQGGLPDTDVFRSIGNVDSSVHCTLAYASAQLSRRPVALNIIG